MHLIHNDSVAGRALELVRDLVKLGRMSNAEARVVEALAHHPELPPKLRQAGEPLDEYGMRGGGLSTPSPKTPPK